MYKAILFDFDGTLSHTFPLWISAWQDTVNVYGGRSLTKAEVVKECFYRDPVDVISTLSLECPVPAELVTELERQLLLQNQNCKGLYSAVVPYLERLKKADVRLGIVTSTFRSVIEDFLQRHSLVSIFDVIISGNDVRNFKPHPEPIELALHQLKISANEALMVGDSRADILSSHAAGTHSALIHTIDHGEFCSLDDLRELKPHHIFDSHSEFSSFLELCYSC